ncbi:MAG: restriction endonuclease [Chlorobiaceae bacterium]|nr:restriction endonuclease [Chlorobiaceae bacterium]
MRCRKYRYSIYIDPKNNKWSEIMNHWGKKTIELAKKKDYLDRLYKIYPNNPSAREIDLQELNLIEEYFHKKDSDALLNKLLDIDKFPIKDSYISFLRTDRSSIQRNPKTVKRICDILYALGLDKVKEGILAPKEANTIRGPQFSNWAKKAFPHVKLNKFINIKNSILFLEDSEKNILDFCNTELGIGISKRPDFVAKSRAKYVVGEAKFLSSLGGNQGRGLDDALKLASNTSGHAYKVAIVDGVLWIQPGSQEYKKIEHSNAAVFSALLLKEYLKKL